MFVEPLFPVLSTVLLVIGIFILCITHDSCGYTIGSLSVIVSVAYLLRVYRTRNK